MEQIEQQQVKERPAPAAASQRRSAADRLRPHLSYLPLVGIFPAFLLAVYSLTRPWAKARVMGLMGISKSPEAVLLVMVTTAGLIAATVAAAMRGNRLRIAAAVHLGIGLLMCAVSFSAYRMVLSAGKKILGIPLASVHPGPGWRLFALAALWVVLLAGVELVVASRRKKETSPRQLD
jgi:hypothetical protein